MSLARLKTLVAPLPHIACLLLSVPSLAATSYAQIAHENQRNSLPNVGAPFKLSMLATHSREAAQQYHQTGEQRAQTWFQLGYDDGAAGASESNVHKRQQLYAESGFETQTYLQGWDAGNNEFWRKLGQKDAAEGVSDQVLSSYVKQAQQRQLRVRQQIYQRAYDRELIEYWRRLARQDALHGRDSNFRSDFARQRGLRFEGTEYQDAWETSLEDYWKEAGQRDARNNRFNLNQQLEQARREQIFILRNSADLYKQAWRAENPFYCREQQAIDDASKSRIFEFDACAEVDQAELRRAYNQGRSQDRNQAKYQQVRGDLQKTDVLIDQLQKQIIATQQELDKLERNRLEQQNQRDRNWQKQVESSQNELQAKERKNKQADQEVLALQEQKQRKLREIEQLESEIHRANERRQNDSNGEQNKNNRRQQELQNERRNLEREAESEQRKIADIEQDIKRIRDNQKDKKSSDGNSSELQRKERERTEMQAELRQTQEKMSRLRQTEDQVRNEFERNRSNFSKPGYDEERLQRKRQELNTDLAKLQRQMEEAKQRNSSADTELRRAQEQRRNANNRPEADADRQAANLVAQRQQELKQLNDKLRQAQELRQKLWAEEKKLR